MSKSMAITLAGLWRMLTRSRIGKINYIGSFRKKDIVMKSLRKDLVYCKMTFVNKKIALMI